MKGLLPDIPDGEKIQGAFFLRVRRLPPIYIYNQSLSAAADFSDIPISAFEGGVFHNNTRMEKCGLLIMRSD